MANVEVRQACDTCAQTIADLEDRVAVLEAGGGSGIPQTLSVAGSQLSISGGNTVTVPSAPDHFDAFGNPI